MAFTAAINGGILSYTDASGTPVSRQLSGLSFAVGVAGVYYDGLVITTGATPITLPTATVNFLYLKNLDLTNAVVVTWTPKGGVSAVTQTVYPGGFVIFGQSAVGASGGITALSLQALVASISVELFLAG